MFYVGFLFQSTGCQHRDVRARLRTDAGPRLARRTGEIAMAKGQVKSNKEVRKPKAEKPKPAVAVGTSPFTQPPGKK